MCYAKKLKSGFHIAQIDSKVTAVEDGIFISYDPNWGDRMDELKDFMIRRYSADPERFPYLFENHIHVR